MKKIILATLGMGLLVIGVNAHATGQGGIGGSAVMRLSGGATSIVSHVSSSIAIGKQSAYTSASGGTGNITANTVAAGASGIVTIAAGLITAIGADTTLNKAQANSLASDTINLDINAATYKGSAN